MTISCPASLKWRQVGQPQNPSPPRTITFFFSKSASPSAARKTILAALVFTPKIFLLTALEVATLLLMVFFETLFVKAAGEVNDDARTGMIAAKRIFMVEKEVFAYLQWYKLDETSYGG